MGCGVSTAAPVSPAANQPNARKQKRRSKYVAHARARAHAKNLRGSTKGIHGKDARMYCMLTRLHTFPQQNKNKNSQQCRVEHGSTSEPRIEVANGTTILGGLVVRYHGKSHAGASPGNPVKENQDAGLVVPYEEKSALFVGVYDGHGENGRKVSQFLIKRFPQHMQNGSAFKSGKYGDAMKSAADVTNNELRRQGFDLSTSGSTGCMLYVTADGKLCTGNVGDSRAVRGVPGQPAQALTLDHKPTLPGELQRIRAKGGRVAPLNIDGENIGPPRVWRARDQTPGLCMSRSFGDEIGRGVGVICEPEIDRFEISDPPYADASDGQYIVVASDGIWEFLENDDVMEIIYECGGDLTLACDTLIERSRNAWIEEETHDGGAVIDDCTAIVLHIAPEGGGESQSAGGDTAPEASTAASEPAAEAE